MRWADRIIQDWRLRKAEAWLPAGGDVLDIGCHQGELLRRVRGRIRSGVGLDPLAREVDEPGLRLLAQPFREPLPFPDASFDAVVMLATLEHFHDTAPVARECRRLLRPGGRVVITVPAAIVDMLVDILVRLRLADGMSLDEHHGFDPATTPAIFEPEGFRRLIWQRFQLGCNHLFVFEKR